MQMYKCRGCNAPPRPTPWRGLCPSCRMLWNCVPIKSKASGEADDDSLAVLHKHKAEFISTGMPEFDRVVGDKLRGVGGIVVGSTILFAGERGTGKTTLNVEICDGLSRLTGRPTLYVSGEESKEDIGKVAGRLGIESPLVKVMGNTTDVYAVVRRMEELKPVLTVLDSLQVITCSDVGGGEGTNAQVEAVANVITSYCKEQKTSAIIVNQMTKDGNYAGSAKVEHLVDTLLMLEHHLVFDDDGLPDAEASKNVRRLFVVGKNRNGDTDQDAFLEMTPTGLKPIRKKSRLIKLSDYRTD